MGGAQPLAVTLNGGVCIIADVDEARLKRRQAKRYLDVVAKDLNEAIALATEAKEQKKPLSVGVVGNASEVFPEMLLRHRAGEFTVDIVTDQTSAHDPLAYLPSEVAFEDWQREAAEDPTTFTKKARESMASQVQAMVEFQDEGAEVFDYGNSIRDEARLAGYNRAFEFPGFVPAYIRPLFCEGLGPFRWAALSGDPEDIRVTDQALKELFPDNEHLHRWLDAAEEFVEFEGLPARICWLGYGERHKAGLLFNQLVKEGKVKAPIVIGRDHLESGGGSRGSSNWAYLIPPPGYVPEGRFTGAYRRLAPSDDERALLRSTISYEDFSLALADAIHEHWSGTHLISAGCTSMP